MPILVAFNTEHPQTTTDARHVPTPSCTARNRLRSVAADSVPDPHQPFGLVGGYPGRQISQGIKLGSKTTVWRAEDIRNLIERSR